MSEENINALIKTFHDTLPKGVANFSEKIIRAREQELEAELKRCEDDITFYGNEIAKHKAKVQELLEALDQCIAYIKTGNHKTLDMELILSIAKLREGGDDCN